jgi:hypothetical protein
MKDLLKIWAMIIAAALAYLVLGSLLDKWEARADQCRWIHCS